MRRVRIPASTGITRLGEVAIKTPTVALSQKFAREKFIRQLLKRRRISQATSSYLLEMSTELFERFRGTNPERTIKFDSPSRDLQNMFWAHAEAGAIVMRLKEKFGARNLRFFSRLAAEEEFSVPGNIVDDKPVKMKNLRNLFVGVPKNEQTFNAVVDFLKIYARKEKKQIGAGWTDVIIMNVLNELSREKTKKK